MIASIIMSLIVSKRTEAKDKANKLEKKVEIEEAFKDSEID